MANLFNWQARGNEIVFAQMVVAGHDLVVGTTTTLARYSRVPIIWPCSPRATE